MFEKRKERLRLEEEERRRDSQRIEEYRSEKLHCCACPQAIVTYRLTDTHTKISAMFDDNLFGRLIDALSFQNQITVTNSKITELLAANPHVDLRNYEKILGIAIVTIDRGRRASEDADI